MEHAPETKPEQPKPRYLPNANKLVALGASALLIMGVGYKVLSDKSGEVTVHEPAITTEQTVDSYLSVVNLNTQTRLLESANEFKEIVTSAKANVVTLQEVTSNDAERLARRYPKRYVTHVVGERLLQEPAGGGFGNVIMTLQKPTDIKSRSIKVNPITDKIQNAASQVLDNVAQADVPFPEFDQLFEERRAIMALTIKVRTGDFKLKDVRIITTHISGAEPVATNQMEIVEKFVKDEIQEDRPIIFCADLNKIPEVAKPRFLKMGFTIPATGPTSSYNQTIDYCMNRDEGVLQDARVVNKESDMSDHDRLEAHYNVERGRLAGVK